LIYQFSANCCDLDVYVKILDKVPITSWGRLYVCSWFTLCVVKRRPSLLGSIVKYWAVRVTTRKCSYKNTVSKVNNTRATAFIQEH